MKRSVRALSKASGVSTIWASTFHARRHASLHAARGDRQERRDRGRAAWLWRADRAGT
nr:hypothetical protein [Brucella sp. 09RB8910]